MMGLAVLVWQGEVISFSFSEKVELLLVGVRASVGVGRWHPLVAGRREAEVAILASVINCRARRVANSICPPI